MSTFPNFSARHVIRYIITDIPSESHSSTLPISTHGRSEEIMTSSPAVPPLTGVRIVDLCHFLAGPYATSVMAHLGADVVKVEDPAHPDEARQIGPIDDDGLSYYFAALNSGKRAVAVDLARGSGREVLERLVKWADVVVSNYRPGVLEKLRLGREELLSINPAVITCSLTAFGETGSYAHLPGYDYTIQALGGVMDLTGEPGGPPGKAGISYVDHAGGLAAALAVSAALFRRERTGVTEHLDVSLLDVQVSMLTYLASWELNSVVSPQRTASASHPILVPAQNFLAADGFFSLFIGNEKMWRRFTAALADRVLDAPDYSTNAARSEHRSTLLPRLEQIFSQQRVEHWVRLLQSVNVACAPVNTVAEALVDPQVVDRALIRRTGGYRYAAGPLPTLEPVTELRPAPALGESTDEVLGDLGFSSREISDLREAHVVS